MTDFNAEPYWDDFESSNGAKDKNYMRLLFRPGYAVQARELTQIQSILQNQLKNFADHVFKDGSPVYGGHITLDTDINYIKLEKTYSGVDVDTADFENAVIFNPSGAAKIRAKVTAVDDSQTQPTLMIRYLRATQFSNGGVITTAAGAYAQLTALSAIGKGSVASIDEGVFYVDGYFVKVAPQTIVLDAYSRAPTYRIGLEIDDNLVDESADANLLDPAQSSFNYQAPGAHRYQFGLRLAKRSLSSVDDQKFFELLRVENGRITRQVNYPIYSEIEKTLARRTFDESGDYIVKQFSVDAEANTVNDAFFTLNIGLGKAYVKGFEYEAQNAQKLTVPKARSSNISTDYDLSLEYGNYLIANNFLGSAQGFFDISTLQQLDLHVVPRANVNYTNLGTYYATYMGTTKILNFDRYGNSNEFLTYLADTAITSNTFVVSSLASNTTSIIFPSNYSDRDNAYVNVLVRVASGNSSGEVRKIISYDSTTRTAFVDRNFPSPIEVSANVVLAYDTKNINSLVEAASNKGSANCAMDVGLNSKDITGSTVMYDTNRKSLIFQLPENYVVRSSIVNADYVVKKYYVATSPTGSNGEIDLVLSGGETFNYGTDGQLLSNLTANANFIITAKAVGTATNVSVGQIVDVVGPRKNILRQSSTQMKIYTDANGTFTPEVVFTVKVNNSESAIRTKTVTGSESVVNLRSPDKPSNGTAVNGKAGVFIDTSNAFVWFTTAALGTTGNTSLYIPDVYKVKKILDSGSTSYAPSSANADVDITNRFYLDSGQNKTFYDHSKLVLKPGATTPRGQTVVMLQHYQHSTTAGYFTVDSYPLAQYNAGSIPVFIDSDGSRYSLKDSIDFRPTRQIGTSANVQSFNFVGMRNPIPSEPMELTYSYYLPRTDKILLTKDREIKILYGIPSRNPIPPSDSESAMTLFKIDIPAYTANVRDVKITTVENKRFTMRDIGDLETRVKNVEYYAALSLIEKKAADITILYEDNATQKEKYGIITDNFTGFKVADFKSDDFRAGIDSGKLIPYADLAYIPLESRTIGAYAKKNDKTISLTYTESSIIEQTTATSTVSVQPYLYGIFDGNLRLIPESDSWFSVSLTPIVISPAQIIAPVETTVMIATPLGTITSEIPNTSSTGLPNTIPVDASGVFGSSPQTTVINTWFGVGSRPDTLDINALRNTSRF